MTDVFMLIKKYYAPYLIGTAVIFLGSICIIPKQVAASIELVGTSTATGNSASYNVSLTALSGGIDTAAAEDDIVLVMNTFASTSNQNPGVSTAGFVEINDLYANDTNDVNFSLSYKIMGSVPDTTVSCNGSFSATFASTCIAFVFRGVDTGQPFDVASTSQYGFNQEDINCPQITPVTDQAVVLCTGGAVGSAIPASVGWPATPAGLTGRTTAMVDVGTAALSLGTFGFWTIGSGPFDVASTTMTMGTQAQNAWAAITVALKPASAGSEPTASRVIRVFSGFTLKLLSGRIIIYGS